MRRVVCCICMLVVSLLEFPLLAQEVDSAIYMPKELERMPRTELKSEELLRYIDMLIRTQPRKYVPRERQLELWGAVIVRFVVEPDGRLTSPMIYRSLAPDFDAESLHLLQSLPCWQPALRYGRAVRAHYYIPFTYPPQPKYAPLPKAQPSPTIARDTLVMP